jgi:hypothetical protein
MVSVCPLPPKRHLKWLPDIVFLVGILQMVLSCPANTIMAHIPVIFDTVEWLIKCQDTAGNWPTRAPTSCASKNNDLLQYVHDVRQSKPIHIC